MQTFKSFLLFPFRLFSNGESIFEAKIENTVFAPKQKTVTTSSSGHVEYSPPSTNKKAQKIRRLKGMGNKYTDFFTSITAAIITAGIFFWFFAFIENTNVFQTRYGYLGVSHLFNYLGLEMPNGPRWLFYKDVLSKAICSSEIALIQIAILLSVLFYGIKLALQALGAEATGNNNIDINPARRIMSLAIVCMPTLGILSTVVGVLSADILTREEAKILIFGPSGIGIVGLLIANGFNFLVEATSEKRNIS